MTFDEDKHGFARNELGLYLPHGARAPAAQPEWQPPFHVGTYISYSDLTDGTRRMDEAGVVERLKLLSVQDCLAALAHIGTRLFTGRSSRSTVERRLIQERVGGELGARILAMLDQRERSTAFCEQQLVHLARLAVLHADRRPHDDFSGGALYAEWITCLFGVTDLLDAHLEIESRDQRIGWEIRQHQLNQHDDSVPTIALHHELYRVLWPQLADRPAIEAEAAFRRHTGISIGDYFAIGGTVLAQLVNRGREEDSFPGVCPETFYSEVSIDKAEWRPFFELNARSVDDLGAALEAEEAAYGPTTYGSLTFERTPLAHLGVDGYVPLSMYAFQRRITEGVIHILAEAAEQEGRSRRYYASVFGGVFQQSVEETFRRGMAIASADVQITADVEYGDRRNRRRSSDVILGYERDPLFVEVVSGPLRAATSTRGDLSTLDGDLDRLVVGKAKQLDTSITDFFDGQLEVRGVDPTLVRRAWPVIVTSHSLPRTPTLLEEIEERIRQAGWLCDERVASLTIISAEELFFCEGFMERGSSFIGLLRGWKSGPAALGPFQNYLVELGGGKAPGSTHFERRFAEANADYMTRLLGKAVTGDDVLAHAAVDATTQIKSSTAGAQPARDRSEQLPIRWGSPVLTVCASGGTSLRNTFYRRRRPDIGPIHGRQEFRISRRGTLGSARLVWPARS